MTTNLVGQYQIANSTLFKQDQSIKLVLGSRSKPTPTKPKFYLLEHAKAGQFKYVSSLYPASEMAENGFQTYSMDYQGRPMILTINREKGLATIDVKNP